nr:hypothetical protein [Sphingomonas sp. Ag1]
MRQHGGGGRIDCLFGELGLPTLLFGFPIRQELGQRGTEHAGQHVRGQIVDLAYDGAQAIARRLVLLQGARSDPGHLPPKLLHEQARVIFSQQAMLENSKARCLERTLADRHLIGAGTTLLMAGAAVIVLAGDRIPGAAAAAADKSRKQVLLAILSADWDLFIRAPALFDLLLYGCPHLISHDPEIRHGYLDPLRAISQPVTALALFAVGITSPLAPPPDQPTNVQRVVEDAGALLRITPNGGGIPLTAAWTQDALRIETGGDLDRGSARGELEKDAAHDCSMLLVDIEQAADDLFTCIQSDDPLVAIGAPAGKAACEHRRLHAAHSLVD